MRQLEDSFGIAQDAREIAERLIDEREQFLHLGQARLLFLFSQPAVTLHGSLCHACIVVPTVQGPLKRFFDWVVAATAQPDLDWEEPDFIVLIDVAAWSSFDAIRRERLVYHELRHIAARENEYGVPKLDAEGRPMLRLIAHDFEAFEDEVAHYGIAVTGLENACIAIAAGIRKDARDAEDARGQVA